MSQLSVERAIWIKAPREQVWAALSEASQIAKWFVPNLPGAEMKQDENGKVSIYMGEMGLDFVLLEVVEPARQIAVRSLPERQLKTTYTLSDLDAGTQVTVTVTGFETLPEGARQDRQHLSGNAWEKTLKNLNAHLEGTALPFPKAYVGPLFGYWREPNKRLGVERSIWIKAPRERVWAAVTDPKQLQQWFSPNTEWQLSALEVGGRFYVNNPETNAEMYVEIIERLDAPHQIVTRTIPESPDTVVKEKTYTLTEEDGGTRLFVTLIGYEPEADNSRWDHMEENAVGFGMMLQNVKAYVEGVALPFPWGF